MRPRGTPRINALRLRRTSCSLPECPSTIALVESQTIASTPASPSAASAASSVRRADHRLGIELPVSGVQDHAGRRGDRQRLRLRDRVGDLDEAKAERRQIEGSARRDHMDLHLVEKLRLGELAPQHGGGERRRVDRTAKPRPQPRDRADMVLMRVGDHQSEQLVAPFGDEARIGHHHLDLRVRRAAEADAAIDREPMPAAAIKVQIHADLARPAQGQEGEIAVLAAHSQ